MAYRLIVFPSPCSCIYLASCDHFGPQTQVIPITRNILGDSDGSDILAGFEQLHCNRTGANKVYTTLTNLTNYLAAHGDGDCKRYEWVIDGIKVKGAARGGAEVIVVAKGVLKEVGI